MIKCLVSQETLLAWNIAEWAGAVMQVLGKMPQEPSPRMIDADPLHHHAHFILNELISMINMFLFFWVMLWMLIAT